jgi:hypothetical protein
VQLLLLPVLLLLVLVCWLPPSGVQPIALA